ncbi:MoxR family ATPase [Luteolibacter pohnpeiensis]|uniref:MoxR family ATPase n=2 Tax=Luteolibacter pohnpeiensis TaxID=454153 RepID=A0A934VWS2_9BACT|nr:MoxR family ATPase [Luteolibacter pohnpeiensis]
MDMSNETNAPMREVSPAGLTEDEIKQASAWVHPLRAEMGRFLIGQHGLVDRLISVLLVRGHVLLEGVPGLAKTLALKTLADLVSGDFHRIQFTPDMLPADIVGTQIFDPRAAEFEVKKGPVFANFILADEINRAPAKVQSALLEAMQEKQVTIGDETFKLHDPFFVLATQNPLEQEGTYPLPEAQLDRFIMKVVVDYPTMDEEMAVIDIAASTQDMPKPVPVVSLDTIRQAQRVVNRVYLDEKVKRYIVSLVHATRRPDDFGMKIGPYLRVGASPRASIGMTLLGKARAFLDGRSYVTPHDIKSIAQDVLRHRVTVSYEAEAEGLSAEHFIRQILDEMPVP